MLSTIERVGATHPTDRHRRAGGAREDWQKDRLPALEPQRAGSRKPEVGSREPAYLTCLFTSFVMSNIDTCDLPKIGRRRSSALIIRRFLASCRPFFLM